MAPTKHIPAQEFNTTRTEGLVKTSLNVLSFKKHHKTQTQKQLHQFNKLQNRHNTEQPPHSVHPARSMSSQVSNPMSNYHHQSAQYQELGPPISSFRNNSSSSYIASHSDSNLSVNQGLLPQGQWTGSSTSFHSQNDSPTSGSLTYNDDGYGYPSSEYHEEMLRYSNDRIKELETENLRLRQNFGAADSSKLTEIEFMNNTLLQENQALRLELRKLQSDSHSTISPSPSYSSTNSELNKTITVDSSQELESVNQELEETQKKNESLELSYEALTQEVSRLKLVHKSAIAAKDREIARLNEDIEELEKELELLESERSWTAETSPETTNEDFPVSKSTLSQPTNPSLPVTSSPKIGGASENSSYNEEVIQQLLQTVRQLRSENQLLGSEGSVLIDTVAKQKKMIRRLADHKNDKVKIRKGFCVLESVDVMI